jgi:alpha-tubulin suppressor-like RCC1 family protein
MENNFLLVLGNNYDGCLMTNDTNDVINFMKIYPDIIKDNNFKISAGMKSLAIYKDNEVNIFGRFIDENVKFIPRYFSLKHKIKKISCGDYHIILLSEYGEGFSYGKGIHGELGLGDVLEVSEPTKLKIENICRIKAGVRNSFLINGKVG